MSGSNPLPAGQWVNVPVAGAVPLGAGNGSGFGGLAMKNQRPLSMPPQYQTRQPYLGQAPAISAIAGFGTGSGGGLINNGSDFDMSQGVVRVLVGLNPSPTQVSIGLMFPFVPQANQYFFTADWGTVGTNIVSSTIILTVNLTRSLIPGEWVLLPYNWTVSN